MTLISTMLLCAILCFIIELAGDHQAADILVKIAAAVIMLIGSVPVYAL